MTAKCDCKLQHVNGPEWSSNAISDYQIVYCKLHSLAFTNYVDMLGKACFHTFKNEGNDCDYCKLGHLARVAGSKGFNAGLEKAAKIGEETGNECINCLDSVAPKIRRLISSPTPQPQEG